MVVLTKSLTARFAELQAERQHSWPEDRLRANASQRQMLVQRFNPHLIAQPGAQVPAVRFADVEGGFFTIAEATTEGPAVLLFLRFATCPACNIALRYYQDTLYPALLRRGVRLIALSPQRPDLLHEIKDRQMLDFTVATDPDSTLARYLGISFVPDDRPKPPPPGWIGDITGTGSWDLPQPTALIVDQNQIIRWIKVSPDWLERPETSEILNALESL
jgi:peroxiredoxin